MYIMTQDPVPDMSPEAFLERYPDTASAQDLADAYAASSNKFWWVEDNEFGCVEGSPEYQAACAVADIWGSLMIAYKDRILAILMAEGVIIPAEGQLEVIEPFMQRYGYRDADGWWVKD